MATEAISQLPMRALLAHAAGGGWGAEVPAPGTSPVAIIRGADFPAVAVGDARGLPVRWEEDQKIPQRKLRPGDIVLEISGGTDERPTGRTVFVTERLLAQHEVPVIPASFCRLVRVDPTKADARWAYFWLQSMYAAGRTWEYQNRSTGLSNFQFNYFLDAEVVDLPPLPEQRRIGHILGTLDDKIELNRRMNETLEETARAVFKSWSVDFDPVRAKAEGRDPGLPPHLADLFPDRLADSALGPIPEGWQAGTLADLVQLNPESWTARTLPETVDYVDLTNTKWGRIAGVSTYARDDAPSRARRKLRRGDTVVGTVRPGNGAYALIGRDDLTGSTAFAVLRPRDARDAALCYLAASRDAVVRELELVADGGAYPAIRPERVARVRLAVPPRAVLDAFADAASRLLERCANLEAESASLEVIRDELLPSLMSAELRPKTRAEPEGR